MPKVSRATASENISLDGLEVRLEHLDGGYPVCFETHSADADLAGLFRGLPDDDRCQFPRWGYVVKGQVTFRFPGRDESYHAGDAYYVPPGHTPLHHNGAELVEFSPTEELGAAVGVVMKACGRRAQRSEPPSTAGVSETWRRPTAPRSNRST
jgi:hypothetical protein